jgi:hypothetical protein
MSYEPKVLYADWSGGANTEEFADNLAPNQSPYPLNVEIEGKSIRKARGFTAFGTEDDTGIGFFLYTHRILSDTEVLARTIDTKLKFYDEITGKYQIISTTAFTAGLRWAACSFNGYLYAGNGTDNWVRWNAASWGTMTGDHAAGAITIQLGTGEGARFAASGNGLIEGDTFAWTGVTGDLLTGVTGLTDPHLSGSRVIEAAIEYASNPKGSVMAFFQNRIFVRDDTATNFLRFSKLAGASTPADDINNFTVTGSGAGDAGWIILPASLLGLQVFISGGNAAVLVAFCADGISYAITVNDDGGTTIGANTPFKVFGESLVGKSMHVITENDVISVTGKGTIRSTGYGEQSTTVKTERLSDIIRPTMETIDFSQGCMGYMDRKVIAHGRINSAVENNFSVIRDTEAGAFLFNDFWKFNDFAFYKGKYLAISSINEKVYELFTGYSADGYSYRSSYVTRAEAFGNPLCFKLANKMRITGYFTANTQIRIYTYLDDSSAPFEYFLLDATNLSITAGESGLSVGTIVVSGLPIGGGGSIPAGLTLKRFRATLEFPTEDFFYTMRILFENNQADVNFAFDKVEIWTEEQPIDLELDRREISQGQTAIITEEGDRIITEAGDVIVID